MITLQDKDEQPWETAAIAMRQRLEWLLVTLGYYNLEYGVEDGQRMQYMCRTPKPWPPKGTRAHDILHLQQGIAVLNEPRSYLPFSPGRVPATARALKRLRTRLAALEAAPHNPSPALSPRPGGTHAQ